MVSIAIEFLRTILKFLVFCLMPSRWRGARDKNEIKAHLKIGLLQPPGREIVRILVPDQLRDEVLADGIRDVAS
jgi:hypothetical protein